MGMAGTSVLGKPPLIRVAVRMDYRIHASTLAKTS
jgi:hypothetical protein